MVPLENAVLITNETILQHYYTVTLQFGSLLKGLLFRAKNIPLLTHGPVVGKCPPCLVVLSCYTTVEWSICEHPFVPINTPDENEQFYEARVIAAMSRNKTSPLYF